MKLTAISRFKHMSKGELKKNFLVNLESAEVCVAERQSIYMPGQESHKDIQKIEHEIVEEFSFFDDWNEKYAYIIDSGKNLKGISEEQKTEANKIKGCQSTVWMTARFADGRVYYEAESDAIIVKGLIALLLRVFSGQTPEDILHAKLDFLKEIGIYAHLSPTRSNGLAAMIKQMKYYALAFKAASKN